MNESRVNDDGESRVERLVDGELSPDEYRALVASLDEEPGGWRHCALAFLEAQALGRELGQVRRGLDLRDEQRGEPRPPTGRANWGELTTWLAIAASFLLVFSLGIVAPKFFSWRQQEGGLAGNFTGQSPLVTDDGGERGVGHQIGNLRLVMDGGGGEAIQAGQVPVYEIGQNVDQFLSAERPALTPDLIEYLREQGYDVRHEQQYFPAPLDDGRQIIVPVDGYQITPVGRQY